MEPIINPWWIYLTELSGGLKDVFLIVGPLGTALMAIAYLTIWAAEEDIKCPKWAIITSLSALILGAILPSKETCLNMMVVSQVTPNNVVYVGETIEDTIDYITEKIEKIINNEEEGNER